MYVLPHLHAVAVTIGIVWAAFVARFCPAEARRELGKSLREFCLNMGWLYTRLVASNSYFPEAQDDPRRQLPHSNNETHDNALASLSPQESAQQFDSRIHVNQVWNDFNYVGEEQDM
ncbi:hypothetical protein PLEOSDRAFT_166977 [Pleurotus ostreatus PC15]|uniref:Uncharacterized protein n=1 Tax=Pleurotus ostreatus (strain PC15) TaxID=1137138 RepID=A0A067NLA8_PLEO1|nr:hypothetical protein PLEOSDRAFT_166977 [Pleurotus ostreatus PC15]